MEGNKISIRDVNGIAEIKIDNVHLKRVSDYKIKRDTNIVELVFTINVSPKDFTLNKD